MCERTPKISDAVGMKGSPMKFTIVQTLQAFKFPIFLISCSETQKKYVLKLFPYENEAPHRAFMNESRFSFLNHPSIISFKQVQNTQKTHYKKSLIYTSHIIMEYAPYGNFAKVAPIISSLKDEKLVRTYFHQLIEAIDYLHNEGVAHMDLKLDNLLLDENFMLKIADFDTAFMKSDMGILGAGTRNYRAPEVKDLSCADPFAADVYSAGVILFVLLTGCFPYLEDHKGEDGNLFELLKSESPLYWKALAKFNIALSKDAKDLFLSMVHSDPVERATLNEVKSSKWFSGEVYSPKELKQILFLNRNNSF